MSGKHRVKPKMAAKNGETDSRATVIMFRNKAMSQAHPVQPKTGVRKRKSARAESLIALEQAHREELERTHLLYTERIRQVEAARLENEGKLERQQDFHANLSEQYRGEVKQRTTELLAAKDLLHKAIEGAAAVEKRLVQMESQRGALEREQRTLHEALQTLREQHAAQVKAATQLQAQRDALVTERRTLHETLQMLREQHVEQGKAGKPVINAPQPGKGAVKSAGLDPIPLPVGRNSMTEEEKALFAEKLACAIKTGGVPALETLLEKQVAGHSMQLAAFCQLKAANMALANGHIADASRMADIALRNDSKVATVRDAAYLHQDAALLEKANQLVDRLESMQETVGAGDRRFIDEVRGQAQLVAWAAEPAAPRNLPVNKGRVLNVLAFGLPYSSVGYATRSHGLAIGIKHAGWDIRPYTRPCFPYDSKPELEGQPLPEQDDIDGITYRRIFDFDRKGMNEVKYLHAAITCLTRVIEQEQPEVVHAASNYVTALPALIAARRLGVPFVYEMRGFWEVTRSSRDEAFENTPKYRFMQLFDSLVARQADHVITITTAMKEELLARGVPESKISIAFNSVDPTRFVPRAPNKALAEKLGIPDGVPVIGYVGSFVDYEGLDDLITAAAGLKQDGRDFRLLLVGDGAAFESIRAQVQALSLDDKVILTGRVPHEEVEDYYSLVAIAPFPRKPWKVCEIVSPLKPFEAMALEKVVVVSSTRALMEIVDHERTGFVFEKGNVDSLRDVLDQLIRQPEKRLNIGKAAREWIVRERSWDMAGKVCAKTYTDHNYCPTPEIFGSMPRASRNEILRVPVKREHNIIPYEDISNVDRTKAIVSATEIMEKGWACGKYPLISLNNPIPWAMRNHQERSWNFHIHCWDIVDSLLKAHSETQDERFICPAIRVAKDWAEQHSNLSQADMSPFAWYDMAVGVRVYRLAYIIDAGKGAGLLDEDLRNKLWASLEQHQAYLADDKNIQFQNNHGYYQVVGQLAMGRRFAGESPLMAQALEQGKERLKVMLAQQFAKDGIHREHSPDYHRMVYDTLKSMIDSGLVEDAETIAFAETIEKALSWFVLPSQHIVNFGDSDYRLIRVEPTEAERKWLTPEMRYAGSGGKVGRLPAEHLAVFSEGGYVVVRTPADDVPQDFSKSSYLAQTIAFHSRTHKHADDLSFIWSDRGSDLLVDAGRYGYIGKTEQGSDLWLEGHWYSDPNRVYCESTRAHNTLEFDGKDLPRKGVKPYGSALHRWVKDASGIVAVETECKHFGSIRRARVLVFLPSKWLVALDWFHDNEQQPHDAKQWFHLAPHLQLLLQGDGYLVSMPNSIEPLRAISLLNGPFASRPYFGEDQPVMQGWWSAKERDIVPNYAFCYELSRVSTGVFATLFSFSNSLATDTTWNKVNVSGRNAQFRWKDEVGSHELRLERPESGDLGVSYRVC